MANDGVGILTDAIARNAAIVLSLPSAGMLRHHKSRFLAEDEGGFWIESAPDERPLIDELVNQQVPVGISFRSGPQKVTFAVPIIQRNPTFQVNAETILESLKLTFPDDVKAIQRRNNYRVRVQGDIEMQLRMWRIPEHFYLKEKPMSAAELPVKLYDLSTGGLGVFLQPKGSEPPKCLADERLRIFLKYKDLDELILEGRLCKPRNASDNGAVRCGIQFKKLENDIEGRQILATLTRIVGELQREEVRRMRLGLKSA